MNIEKIKKVAKQIPMNFPPDTEAKLKAVNVEKQIFKLGNITFQLMPSDIDLNLTFIENFCYLELVDDIQDEFNEQVSIQNSINLNSIKDRDFIGITLKNHLGIVLMVGYIYINGKILPHFEFNPHFIKSLYALPNILSEINK